MCTGRVGGPIAVEDDPAPVGCPRGLPVLAGRVEDLPGAGAVTVDGEHPMRADEAVGPAVPGVGEAAAAGSPARRVLVEPGRGGQTMQTGAVRMDRVEVRARR